MTEEFNEFGKISNNFDELVKKYKRIDTEAGEDEPEDKQPDEPSAPSKTQPDAEQGDFFTPEEKALLFGDDDSAGAFEPAPKQPEVSKPKPTPPVFAAKDSFIFDGGMLDDDAKEPEADAEKPAPVEEKPKFAYDLNIFGGDEKAEGEFTELDDSWLDESLDESIFHRPDPVDEVTERDTGSQAAAKSEQADTETAAEPVPEPEPKPEPESERQTGFIETPAFETPLAAESSGKVAGGYIAPIADTFAFDEDSGLDFGDEEEDMTVFEPVKPDTKEKKKKRSAGKNDTTALTDFDKDYKEGEKGVKAKKGNFFTRNLIPRKDDSAGEIIRKVVMCIAVLAIIGSAGYLFNDYVIMPYSAVKNIEELNHLIGDSDEVADDKSLKKKYPGIVFPDGILEKYVELYARNQDYVGWLNIESLDISLPVVQGKDNAEYLKTDFDGNKNKYGSLFMNFNNNVQNLNTNTTIFGHNMNDTKMLGNIVQYKSVKGYKKAPVIEFNTIYGSFKWKVFAVVITNGTKAGDSGYLFNYMFTDLADEQEFEEYLGEVKQRSIYYPSVDIAPSDKLLTISTCIYDFDEARLVILARMVRKGESEGVDTTKIRFNPNPRYPQAYYDEKKLKNPYATAQRWYVSQ